jgi:hypothetical protein
LKQSFDLVRANLEVLLEHVDVVLLVGPELLYKLRFLEKRDTRRLTVLDDLQDSQTFHLDDAKRRRHLLGHP